MEQSFSAPPAKQEELAHQTLNLSENTWASLEDLPRGVWIPEEDLAPLSTRFYGACVRRELEASRTQRLCPTNFGCQRAIDWKIYRNPAVANAIGTLVEHLFVDSTIDGVATSTQLKPKVSGRQITFRVERSAGDLIESFAVAIPSAAIAKVEASLRYEDCDAHGLCSEWLWEGDSVPNDGIYHFLRDAEGRAYPLPLLSVFYRPSWENIKVRITLREDSRSRCALALLKVALQTITLDIQQRNNLVDYYPATLSCETGQRRFVVERDAQQHAYCTICK